MRLHIHQGFLYIRTSSKNVMILIDMSCHKWKCPCPDTYLDAFKYVRQHDIKLAVNLHNQPSERFVPCGYWQKLSLITSQFFLSAIFKNYKHSFCSFTLKLCMCCKKVMFYQLWTIQHIWEPFVVHKLTSFYRKLLCCKDKNWTCFSAVRKMNTKPAKNKIKRYEIAIVYREYT